MQFEGRGHRRRAPVVQEVRHVPLPRTRNTRPRSRSGENPVTADRIQEIRSAFETEYEREYTYRLDAPVEMVGIHVTATVRVGRAEIKEQELGPPSPKGARKSSRKVDFAQEGAFEAAIYDGSKLRPGMRFAGPAIVEDPASTVVVHRGNQAQVDGFGNIVIHIREGALP